MKINNKKLLFIFTIFFFCISCNVKIFAQENKEFHLLGRKLVKYRCLDTNVDNCVEIFYLGNVVFKRRNEVSYNFIKTKNDKQINEVIDKIIQLTNDNICTNKSFLNCLEKNITNMIFYQVDTKAGRNLYKNKDTVMTLNDIKAHIIKN
jgi:hypothetical protein